MNAKHTPGPWIVKNTSVTGKLVQAGHELQGWSKEFANPADATLIAAAPDLLEALEAVVDEVNASGCQNYMTAEYARVFAGRLEAAKLAIAKARGES